MFKFNIGDIIVPIDDLPPGLYGVIVKQQTNISNSTAEYQYTVQRRDGSMFSCEADFLEKSWKSVQLPLASYVDWTMFKPMNEITSSNPTYKGVDDTNSIGLSPVDPEARSCNHKWLTYDSGFTMYEYCKICDIKKLM